MAGATRDKRRATRDAVAGATRDTRQEEQPINKSTILLKHNQHYLPTWGKEFYQIT